MTDNRSIDVNMVVGGIPLARRYALYVNGSQVTWGWAISTRHANRCIYEALRTVRMMDRVVSEAKADLG